MIKKDLTTIIVINKKITYDDKKVYIYFDCESHAIEH